jgi:N utilization substance protein A
VDVLKGIGCDTARDVLNLKAEEIIRRSDLEEETVHEIIRILSSEFEES